MKKSKLKNIIRESIQELINEQAPEYVKLNTRVCSGGMTMGLCVPTGAQVGDVYHVPSVNRDVFVREILGSCQAYLYNHYGQPYPISSTNCPNCCSTSQWQSYQDDIGGDCWANCPNPYVIDPIYDKHGPAEPDNPNLGFKKSDPTIDRMKDLAFRGKR